ncbi:MAG: response regulator [Caryophanon sp.]|nr:response regulator [Caryophanon sp.]
MNSILVVDDEKGIRLLLQEFLKKEGYSTTAAANGEEALLFAKEHTFSCALLDMRMPGMSGLEVLVALKQLQPTLPVMMMTAYGEKELIEQASNLGVTHYFTKPFSILEVRDVLRKILQKEV